jgi:hypothetical protein
LSSGAHPREIVDISDLDREDLACAGLRRVSDDFLAGLDREARLAAFRPRANPAPPRPRQRKPSLARLVAKAKQLGVDVTIEPDGTATFRTGTVATDASDPETELKNWIASHAH